MPSEAEPTGTVTEEQPSGQREELGPADRAYAALSKRIAGYRRAVAAAEDEVRAELLRSSGVRSYPGEQVLIELGPFAAGRIDPDRFAMLLGTAEEALTPDSIDVLGEADAILRSADHSTHRVTVEPGGDLRNVVKDGLAHLGRAFGAARAVELARSGSFDPAAHGHLLGPLPFRLWNRMERRLGPPLLVEVRGEDCLPAGLGEFLDGAVTLVIVATGPTTPAPLARLVTPGTFVMQTASADDLARLDETEHPSVVLLFDQDRPEQAHFVHDPVAGDTPWARLTVSRMPEETTVGRGRRPPVWVEELAHLRTLAEAPPTAEAGRFAPGLASSPTGDAAGVYTAAVLPGPNGAGSGPAPTLTARSGADPAERLAAWLVAQSDVSDL